MIFDCIVLLKMCLRFLKFYLKLEILIILSFVVSSLVDNMFNYKAPFLTKKTSAVKPETHFNRGGDKVSRGKVLKKNSITARSQSPVNLFVMQNSIEIKVRTCSFGKKNLVCLIVFFIKNICIEFSGLKLVTITIM